MAEGRATLLIQLRDMVSKSLTALGGKLDKFTKNLDKSKLVFGAIAAAGALVGKTLLSAADKMEGWTISFKTMLGSAGAATKLMEEVRDFAAKTPFELPSVIKGTKGLLAFGVEAEKIIPTLKMLGDVSAGLGVPMERLILNFGQVKAQAKLTGRELRDFAIAGVPLLGTLAKNMSKTEEEIGEMVSAGKIGFADVEEAFKSMSGEGGRFANLMEEQMTTLAGVTSNVRDQFFQLSAEMGTYLLPAAKAVGRLLLKLFETIRDLSPRTKVLILAIGGLVTALTGLLATLGAFVAIAPYVGAAWAVITGPIGLAIAAIIGIGAAAAGMATNILGVRDIFIRAFEDMLKVLKDVAGAMGAFFTFKFKEAVQKAKDALTGIGAVGRNAGQELKKNILEAVDEMIAGVKSAMSELTDTVDMEAQKIGLIETDSFRLRLKKADAFTKLMIKLSKARTLEEQKQIALRVSNTTDALNFIASMSTSKNKELAGIGKAAAIVQATIDTYVAATKALASTIPPFNFILAGAVTAAGLANVDKIRATPAAEGGVILPRTGGTLVRAAEAGRPEAFLPLEDETAREKLAGVLGGPTINIYAGTIIADDMSIREFAEKIDEKLFELRHNKEAVSF